MYSIDCSKSQMSSSSSLDNKYNKYNVYYNLYLKCYDKLLHLLLTSLYKDTVFSISDFLIPFTIYEAIQLYKDLIIRYPQTGMPLKTSPNTLLFKNLLDLMIILSIGPIVD